MNMKPSLPPRLNRLLLGTALALATASAALVPVSAALAQTISLRIQTSSPVSDPQFRHQQDWAELVAQESGGRLKIDLMPVGTVVEYNETLDAVAAGILDGHICDPSYWAGREPAFSLIGNPVGAWSAPEQMLDFMENGGGKALMQDMLGAYGLHLLGYATLGLESFVSRVPIDSVADLKGVKLRAPEGMVANVFAAAGATPVNLPFAEVFTSLDKAVIDAADVSAFAVNDALGLNDIARHPIYPGFHSMPMTEISLNQARWDALPADLQAVLTRTAQQYQRMLIDGIREADLKAVAAARAKGSITIHDWPAEERAKFRRIAMTEWAKAAQASAMSQKVYDALTAYLKAQGLI